jgi:hypothetical protein
VRAQFGPGFRPFGDLRRRRNELSGSNPAIPTAIFRMSDRALQAGASRRLSSPDIGSRPSRWRMNDSQDTCAIWKPEPPGWTSARVIWPLAHAK